MIKLSAGAVLLTTPAGTQEPLNLDGLSDKLWQCCKQAKLDDPELADNLISTVRQFLELRVSEGAHLTQRDVDDLIVRALTDLGVRAVAVEYASGMDLPTPGVGQEIVPTAEAVAELLRDDLLFLHRPIDAISEATLTRISSIGFERVTPAFVLELAKCVCLHEERQKRQEPARYWLLHRSEMPPLIPSEHLPLISGGISLRSVSLIFPNVVIDVDIPRFAHGDEVLGTELAFLPAFHELCMALSEVAVSVYRAVKKRSGDLQLCTVGASIHFVNTRAHATEGLALSPRDLVLFLNELEAIASRCLPNVHCLFE